MKKYVFMSLLMLLFGNMTVFAQNRMLKRETSKMYKTKIKEYKKTGWKLAGSSKTLEVALLEHYEKMKDPQNVELVGEVSQCKSLNVCKQTAYNNALITYANLAGSTLKGRIVSDLNVDQSDEEGEFDKMYARIASVIFLLRVVLLMHQQFWHYTTCLFLMIDQTRPLTCLWASGLCYSSTSILWS